MRMTHPAPLTDANETRSTAVRFGYRIGSLGLLVGVGVLSERLSKPTIFPIPNVPNAIRGYVNLQGALVPVWDLPPLLADGAQLSDESVLVLGRGEHRVGMIINGLPRALKKLERIAHSPPLPDALQGSAKEAHFADDALWFEFDYEGFFRVQTERAAN